MKYKDLSLEQKKEICNGCGGKGGWIKPPHAAFFNTSCNRHDFSYWRGCTEENRLKADMGLYRSMITDCQSLGWFQYLRYRPWCWAYYQGVRISGKKYFYYADEKRYLP